MPIGGRDANSRRISSGFHARDLDPEPEDKVKILHKIEHGLDEETHPAAAQSEPKKNGG